MRRHESGLNRHERYTGMPSAGDNWNGRTSRPTRRQERNNAEFTHTDYNYRSYQDRRMQYHTSMRYSYDNTRQNYFDDGFCNKMSRNVYKKRDENEMQKYNDGDDTNSWQSDNFKELSPVHTNQPKKSKGKAQWNRNKERKFHNNDHKKKHKKNGPPDRWEMYSKIGFAIENFILPMKVPLKPLIGNKIEFESERYSCEDSINLIRKQEKQELGMVINLCNTKRYYDETEFTSLNIKYKHIPVEGHFTPKNSYVKEFVKAVTEFQSDKDNEMKIIAVHCTHGINRTGYIICRYLIDHKGMLSQEAIKLFNKARGHDIERQNYIDDLLSRHPVA